MQTPWWSPPDDQGRRRIEQGVRAWLASEDATSQVIDIEGLTFRVVGDSCTGRAEMLPVQDGASAHRQIVVEAIQRKVSKYRRTVEEMNLPFLVVLSADPRTGLNPDLVTSILAGNNTTSTVLPANSVGPISMGPIQLLQTHTPPGFDRALSAVAWLEINDGADAELTCYWANEQAPRRVFLQSLPE